MAGTATPVATADTGNTWLEGLLIGNQWSSGGGDATISVYIAGQGGAEAVTMVGSSVTALGTVTAAEVDAMVCAMEAIAAVCDVNFLTVGSQADADIIWASVDNLDGQGALGWANPPAGNYSSIYGDYQSLVTVNQDAYVGGSRAVGSYDYITFIHELGHALGLAHPHDASGNSTIFPSVSGPFGDFGTYDMNQGIYTMMSYNDGWQTAPQGTPPSADYGYQGTPMALDIAALQSMYGANTSTATGNDTYTLPGNNASGTFYSCIWDNGGTDTIVGASGLANLIDLRAATLGDEAGGGGFVSYASGIHGGFTIANGVTIENATGGNADDAIIGNDAANTLDGLAGADAIDGGAGNDTIDGGADADTLTGGDDDDSLVGGGGADSLAGGGGNDVLDGGDAADTFVFEGLFGADTLSAAADVGATDNVIRFGSLVTADMITYALDGTGNHLLITVSGGSGGTQQQGTILIEGWTAAQAGGGGFGSMVWTAGGGGTVDLTAGLAAPPADPGDGGDGGGDPAPADPVVPAGTSGNNTINGTSDGEAIDAQAGSDRVYAGGGDDTVLGGFGYDLVEGGDGADTISGDQGNDTLRGEAGADTIDGGSGYDRVEGGDGADLVFGGSGRDTLRGDAGADTLDGGAHDDRLYGGADGDSLMGAEGNDKLFGDSGDDTLDGGSGADRVVGGLGNDVMDGGRDGDYMLGGGDDDAMLGGSGEDRLFGEDGSDTLDGGDGADRLEGGAGDDMLDGGRQSDVFVFSGAFGNDVITGFDDSAETRRDNLDRIDLSAFRTFNGGLLRMRDVLLTDVGSDVVVQLDLDSDGVADLADYDGDAAIDVVSIVIQNHGAAELSVHDFIF